MSQFKYTLPSGSTFTMDAPEGTTQAQADYIFYSQLAAGSLVGIVPGQSISGTTSTAVKFALSRLDRGTAGVDDQVVLAIISGLPTISEGFTIPDFVNIPLENPITQADFVNINADNTFAPTAIGPLNSSQVQGLMAQVANFVTQQRVNQGIQSSNATVNQNTGIGIYGLFCEQLEQAGYVKPGTYLRFIAINPNDFVSTMNSPGIWTGLNGIYSLDEFLNSLSDQSTAHLTLMHNGYESLTAVGVIKPPVTQSISSINGYVYTQSGLQTVSQLSSITGFSISVPANSGSSLAGTPLASLLSTPLTNPGSLASGAVNSTGTNSLSNVSTGITSALTNTVTAWIKNSGLGNLTNLANGNLGSITGALDKLTSGGIAGLTQNIQSLNVLGKASQFATGFANPLTGLSNLGNFNLSSLGNLSNLPAGLPSLSSLTAGLPSLAGLTSGIPNLSSLGSINALTSGLPGLSNLGSLSSLGNLGSLSSLGSLGNFSSLANLGSLSSLGSIGGLFGGGGDSLVSATKVAAGFTNTVNRSVVDAAFVRVLGSSKIPVPSFDFPSIASLANKLDVSQAQSVLKSLPGQGSQVFGQTVTI
jgi:hypothetical protein